MAKIVQDYVLLEVIGKGQFGEVFKAKKQDSTELIAIKMIERSKLESSKECEDTIIDEIQCLRRGASEKIVQFQKWIQTTNNVYLVYEFCAGGNLDESLKVQKKLSEEYALGVVFLQLLEGCISLKSKGIIHGDIKPSNILFKDEQKREVKIADFGFSSIIGMRKIGQNRGSPIYMSPELLRGSAIDFSCDVYSLGVVLFEITQGNVPFEDTVVDSLVRKKERQELSFSQEAFSSSFLVQMLKDMLNVQPTMRPTVEQLASRLSLYNLKWVAKTADYERDIISQLLNTQPKGRSEENQKVVSQINANNSSQDKIEEERRQLRRELGFGNTKNISKNLISPTNDQNKLGDQKMLEVSLKILKERNKAVYINNVISAVIDVSASDQSSLVVMILMKQLMNLQSRLLSQFRSSELNSFKISTSHWSRFRISSDYEKVLNTLQSEQKEIHKNFASFEMSLSPDDREQFAKIESSLTQSTTNFIHNFSSPSSSILNNSNYTKVLSDYCLCLQEKAKNLSSTNQQQLALRMLIHLNNILDGFDIDAFFDKFISEQIKRLSLQTYFSAIQSLSYQELTDLVACKLDALW